MFRDWASRCAGADSSRARYPATTSHKRCFAFGLAPARPTKVSRRGCWDGVESHVGEDPLGGVVPCRADHRPSGVAARTAGVEAFDRIGVRVAIGEPDRVVDMMNVTSADA